MKPYLRNVDTIDYHASPRQFSTKTQKTYKTYSITFTLRQEMFESGFLRAGNRLGNRTGRETVAIGQPKAEPVGFSVFGYFPVNLNRFATYTLENNMSPIIIKDSIPILKTLQNIDDQPQSFLHVLCFMYDIQTT